MEFSLLNEKRKKEKKKGGSLGVLELWRCIVGFLISGLGLIHRNPFSFFSHGLTLYISVYGLYKFYL